METKKLNQTAAVTTVNSNQSLILTDGNGNASRISLADLKKSLLAGVDLNAISDGVFVMYHANSDDYPRMVKPEKWTGLQNSGEVAEGVVVVEGGHILVVAPTEAPAALTWSSAEVSGGGTTSWDRNIVLNDWKGKENTASQIQHAECSGESFAPGFCAHYSRVNANGKGQTAGKWWLPSLGEMMMIYANMRKINYALSFVAGSEPLTENYYWTSTEGSATHAWTLNLNTGSASNSAKATSHLRVRAVSAF